MKKTVLGILLILLIITAPASAQYTGDWTQVWDFNNGTQGWNLNGGYFDNWTFGQGVLYLPDTSFATLADPTFFGLGGRGNSKFVIQVDIFVGGNNYLQGSGIGVVRNSDNKGVLLRGTAAGSQGMSGKDVSWDNVNFNKSWGLSVGHWTTVQIDYGWTVADKFSMYYKATPGNGAGWEAGSWQTICSNRDVHPNEAEFEKIIIGGLPWSQSGASPWAQAYYDNVSILFSVPEPDAVPEPGNLLALGTGMVALCGIVIRKNRIFNMH
ncbi:MAG: PEP-CTERM sorting domain-containing protein [Armatimonadota bacterium]